MLEQFTTFKRHFTVLWKNIVCLVYQSDKRLKSGWQVRYLFNYTYTHTYSYTLLYVDKIVCYFQTISYERQHLVKLKMILMIMEMTMLMMRMCFLFMLTPCGGSLQKFSLLFRPCNLYYYYRQAYQRDSILYFLFLTGLPLRYSVTIDKKYYHSSFKFFETKIRTCYLLGNFENH